MMRLWRIAWITLWSRPLVTTLTLTGIALGCALIAAVLTLRRETEQALVAESGVFDMVVGAKGSPLQLVLSSIYHLDVPTGNIPLARYEALKRDSRVRAAVPIGLGDNYQGFRIVGTEPAMFDLKGPDGNGKKDRPLFALREGALFAQDFDVVLGERVAQQTGLKVGDSFVGSHGLVAVAGSEEHKEFPYKVVGILKPSGASSDRAIYTPLGSVWRIHEREAELHGKKPKEREVTAVLVQLRSVGMRLFMSEEIKNRTESMAAIPITEMLRLYQQVLAPFQKALLGMAGLVVVVAALTMLTTLYQATERRRRELAVMRALGAHPGEIFALIMLEAVVLTICGIGVGWLLGHGGVSVAGRFFQHSTGLSLGGWSIDRTEGLALGWVGVVGVLAGLLPAWLTYRRSPVRDLSAM